MLSFMSFKRWFGFNTLSRKPQHRLRARLTLETLEDRLVPASILPSIDGTGNNLAHVDWGSAGTTFLRIADAEYGDSISTPGGADRPSARVISNTINAQPDGTPTNDRLMSAFIFAWGQFIDHDLDLTLSARPAVAFSIQIPIGDPQFDPNSTGTQIIPLNRSNFDPTTGTGTDNPREQVNSITAWIDASMVYGSNATTAASVRTFAGGRLKTSDGNLLPTTANGSFFAGDIRVNENPVLQSLQTLFLREHNRLADKIAAKNPNLIDEEIFQQARRLVIAEIQAITYNEFLPALLGPSAPRAYHGYDATVNPGIATEFATAGFRIGHTLVNSSIEFLDNNGNAVRAPLSLRAAFFNTSALKEVGIDAVLKGAASNHAQEVDTKIIDDLRNFLFGPPGAGGLDLASLNIQRGRDHGLADYNATRVAYGLKPVTTFVDITSDRAIQQKLQDLYGNVDNIDLWVGGLAEDHIHGASVGATFSRIISDQFSRSRAADRFWFENTFSGRELAELKHTSLADIIRRNTGLTNLQENVFFFKASITGRVFADVNQNGRVNPGDHGLRGRLVQLLDVDGNVLKTVLTKLDGSYRFDGLELGTYQVREVVPNGVKLTTPPPLPIKITRGMTVSDINFGEAVPKRPQARGPIQAIPDLSDDLLAPPGARPRR